MYDPRHMNGHAAGTPPSHTDIMLSRLDNMMWEVRGQIGGLHQGQNMLIDAVKEGFNKTHHAHARITRAEGRIEALESRPTGAAIQTPTGWIGGLTALLVALRELLPPLWHTVAIMALLAAGLGMTSLPVEKVEAVVNGLSKP